MCPMCWSIRVFEENKSTADNVVPAWGQQYQCPSSNSQHMNQSLQEICAWQNQQEKVYTCTMTIALDYFAKEFRK